MTDSGNKETKEKKPSYVRSVRQPSLEQDIISASETIRGVLASTNILDLEARSNACLYLALLNEYELMDEIEDALNFLVAGKSINMQSIKYAVQAHGGLFWDTDASKQDKEVMAKMMNKQRNGEGEKEPERR